jgi:peptide/nickel transport system ATP-binding protein
MMETQDQETMLDVQALKKYFTIQKGFMRRVIGQVRAVDDVSFMVRKGELVSLVGESGCGKTTTARCIMRAYQPTSGQIQVRTRRGTMVDIGSMPKGALRALRPEIQMIFQDPVSSLNPRMTVHDIIAEGLEVNGMGNRDERTDRVAQAMKMVGLRPEYMRRFPHAFSGGERQRIGIARALVLNPNVIVADEPVSALDVSVQAQILNLLLELQTDLELTMLFIAHDLSVVKHISNRVIVMYVGQIVEAAETMPLYENPLHPYTEALLSSVPKSDPLLNSRHITLEGEVANPANPPSGCYFHPRCQYALDICKNTAPVYEEIRPGHWARCHRARELSLCGIVAR